MKILVTGAKGFVGRNLVADLKVNKIGEVFEYDRDSSQEDLERWTAEVDFIYHLAGVNRPENEEEFMEGNFGFTSELLELLKKHNNKAPIMISSSIQAALDNPYGNSKKAGEDLMFQYAEETGAKVYVYRFANLFGKWSRPNYNTVVATFCHRVARNEEIQVNNPEALIELTYIDDVISELKLALEDKAHKDGHFNYVPLTYPTTVGHVADLIKSFKVSREDLYVPNQEDGLSKKLYATYLSFLPENRFSYELDMKSDDRGSFTEFLKSPERGQVSINVAHPGILKGQHWHHSKNEKFLVVQGSGMIRFRKYGEEEVIEYPVSGKKLEVVDIPTGYTHSILNTGDEDMVTVMWANEVFEPKNPDTYYEEV
ncbi:capsular polysaccharide biosynthesis protein CapF [Aerococcus urinaeequi]|uniref:capsular polysaccharide biosynthesis protein CapF n=1 Tax=Aerococcus urinaeequi TaxID=51665 RepID=UPI003D6B4BF6